MNIYEHMNNIIDYLEAHILENIKITDLSHLTGLNVNMIKNVFPCLTGVGINEYVRYRRLSLCVNDLQKGTKIIDVALKYGYSGEGTFQRAFKKFHGINPTQVKKDNTSLVLFNKIIFAENLISLPIVDYKLVKDKKFNLYGVKTNIADEQKSKEINTFWQETKKKYPEFNKNIRYGLFERLNDGTNDYYCLLDRYVKGFIMKNITENDYFVFKINSFSAETISRTIKKGICEYTKSLKLSPSKQYSIEVYYPDYVELWISLK